ncbi:MAG: RNase adapter RapZ [Proteobacteria bacterium]|nr:RNase adapter RapZ [Pseudomonadota bacterium]
MTSISDAAPQDARDTADQLVIITGLSGAGKSTAMRAFEDLGYYCIDNLPPGLIPQFLSLVRQSHDVRRGVAIASDIRSGALFDEFQNAVAALREAGVSPFILYLDCAADVLVNRFNEVRRAHPLEPEFSLEQAIEEDRRRLAPVRGMASAIVDTAHLRPDAFRQEVIALATGAGKQLATHFRFISFGFKYGMPQDADYVFDVRFLPNPFYDPALRPQSGQDEPVQQFVMAHAEATRLTDMVCELLDMTKAPFAQVGKLNVTVAFGCTGGRHRSVTFVERLAAHYRDRGFRVSAVHRDLHKGQP